MSVFKRSLGKGKRTGVRSLDDSYGSQSSLAPKPQALKITLGDTELQFEDGLWAAANGGLHIEIS